MMRRGFTRRGALLGLTAAVIGLGAGLRAEAASEAASEAERIVTLGGTATEIVYALGAGARLVARDTTSNYPPEALSLPDVGYVRALSAEGVLSMAPDLILAEEGAGPPEVVALLKAADVDYIELPEGFSREMTVKRIEMVGAALGREAEAEALAGEVLATLDAAAEAAKAQAGDAPKRVLFVLSAQGGRIMAGGDETAAKAVIELAGGVNAVSGFSGYKPLTDEAVSLAQPDVILMMDRGGDHDMAAKELLALPAFQPTPAAERGAVIRMDGLRLLGFGPRVGAAVRDLNHALYGG